MNALTNEEKARLILSVGKGGSGGKRLLAPMQVAEYIDRSIKAGTPMQSLASQLTISPDMISRFLSLLKLSPSVQSIVDFSSSATTLSFSVAHQIARLDNSADQEELAKTAIACKFSKQDVSQVIQRYIRSGDSIDKATDAILALRPQVERRHVVIGAVTSDALKARISEIKVQDQRDSWGKRSLLAAFPDIDYAIRITPDRLTLSGDDVFFAALMKLKPDFETAINAQLQAKINDL